MSEKDTMTNMNNVAIGIITDVRLNDSDNDDDLDADVSELDMDINEFNPSSSKGNQAMADAKQILKIAKDDAKAGLQKIVNLQKDLAKQLA